MNKWLRASAVLTLVALAMMVWSVLRPTPLPVMLAMSLGQAVGTAAFGTLPGLVLVYYLTDTLGVPALAAGIVAVQVETFDPLRHAFGMPETPPNTVLVSLAALLTAFVMGPTFSAISTTAAMSRPWANACPSTCQTVPAWSSTPIRRPWSAIRALGGRSSCCAGRRSSLWPWTMTARST